MSENSLPKTDVVVATVVPEVELRATLLAFGINEDTPPDHKAGGFQLWRTIVESRGAGQPLKVAIVTLTIQGNRSSAALTGELLARLQPNLAVLVGMAAGVEGKISLGDVVVSEAVWATSSGTAEAAGLVRKPEEFSVDRELLQQLKTFLGWEPSKTWQSVLIEAQSRTREADRKFPHARPIPNVETAHLVGQELILKDGSIPQLRREVHERVRAVDTEAAGFATAASLQHVQWFVVRGVADFGNPTGRMGAKEGLTGRDMQFPATLAAASVVVAFLRSGYYPNAQAASVRGPPSPRRQAAPAPPGLTRSGDQPAGKSPPSLGKRPPPSTTISQNEGIPSFNRVEEEVPASQHEVFREHLVRFCENHPVSPLLRLPLLGKAVSAVGGSRLLVSSLRPTGTFDVSFDLVPGPVEFEILASRGLARLSSEYSEILAGTRAAAEKEQADWPKICLIGAKYLLTDRDATLGLTWTPVKHSDVVAMAVLLNPPPDRRPRPEAIKRILGKTYNPLSRSPNGLCLDCVVITLRPSDLPGGTPVRSVILCHRSPENVQPEYFPGSWMASATENPRIITEKGKSYDLKAYAEIEEVRERLVDGTLRPEAPVETAQRGIMEELGFTPKPEQIHLVGFSVEEVTLNYHLIAIVETGIGSAEVYQQWREHAIDDEIDALIELPLYPPSIVSGCVEANRLTTEALRAANSVAPKADLPLSREMHPTAALGLLAAQWWVSPFQKMSPAEGC